MRAFRWGPGGAREDNSGSIFILVVWTLFILASLGLVLRSDVRARVSLAEHLKQKASSYYLAKAGIDRTRKLIAQDPPSSTQALKQWWNRDKDTFDEVHLPGGYYSVFKSDPENAKDIGLIDEERKININRVPIEVLRRVFEMGARVSSEQAEAIAESIMDWRDPNDYPMENGAESDYYKSLEHPYKAKNKDFQMLDELLLVKGVSPDIYERVKNYLTVYGKGTVNINTAGTVVLTSLGLTEDLAERIIKYRNGDDRKEGTDDDRTFDQADQIPEVLTLDRVIDQDGVTQLQRVLTSNWLGTHSDNFSGVCQGIARGAAGLTRVDFVISRDQTIWFWRQE